MSQRSVTLSLERGDGLLTAKETGARGLVSWRVSHGKEWEIHGDTDEHDTSQIVTKQLWDAL